MGEVVTLPVETTLDTPPDRVLSAALGRLGCVVVIGTEEDGRHWLSSSTSDLERVLWLLERAKRQVGRMGDTE